MANPNNYFFFAANSCQSGEFVRNVFGALKTLDYVYFDMQLNDWHRVFAKEYLLTRSSRYGDYILYGVRPWPHSENLLVDLPTFDMITRSKGKVSCLVYNPAYKKIFRWSVLGSVAKVIETNKASTMPEVFNYAQRNYDLTHKGLTEVLHDKDIAKASGRFKNLAKSQYSYVLPFSKVKVKDKQAQSSR